MTVSQKADYTSSFQAEFFADLFGHRSTIDRPTIRPGILGVVPVS